MRSERPGLRRPLRLWDPAAAEGRAARAQPGGSGKPTLAPGRNRRQPAGVVPEINVTPLVDVVLVLLIIFMVIAPQLEQGLRVELPGIHHPDPKTKGAFDPVLLTVTFDGKMLLEKEPVGVEELAAALRQVHQREPGRRLVLKADRAITYGRARELFQKAQDAGFAGVSLMIGDKARRVGEEEPGEAQ